MFESTYLRDVAAYHRDRIGRCIVVYLGHRKGERAYQLTSFIKNDKASKKIRDVRQYIKPPTKSDFFSIIYSSNWNTCPSRAGKWILKI